MINVLSAALSIIPKQQIIYKKFLGVVSNEIGIMVNSYAPPITCIGSIQPASADTLYKLGIADSGDIFTCVLHGDVLSISELQSNDVIIDTNGQIYNVFKSDKWSTYPGQDWNRIFIRRAKNYAK